jgi:putative ABC transport system permease protein
LRWVVGQGFRLAAVGLLIGLVAGLALMRFVSSLLFGISTHDPATFGIVALVLATVAFFACYVPARRATRVSPVIALRYE